MLTLGFATSLPADSNPPPFLGLNAFGRRFHLSHQNSPAKMIIRCALYSLGVVFYRTIFAGISYLTFRFANNTTNPLRAQLCINDTP